VRKLEYKTLAIIPARSGSKRLKDKNIKNLNGMPLIAYSILSAMKSGVFDRVIVSTDSEKYAEISKYYGAKIDFIRPKHLSSSSAKSIDLIRHAIEYYDSKDIIFDVVCLLQPTSPLRTSNHIKKAFELFKQNPSDSVISVTKGRGSNLCLKAISKNGSIKFNGFEECETLNNNHYYPNGAIYFFNKEFIKNNDFYFSNMTYLFEMKKEESIDIDTQNDFNLARVQLKKINEN
jgi:CMP-N-acetylneuraminic acid synthetase